MRSVDGSHIGFNEKWSLQKVSNGSELEVEKRKKRKEKEKKKRGGGGRLFGSVDGSHVGCNEKWSIPTKETVCGQ